MQTKLPQVKMRGQEGVNLYGIKIAEKIVENWYVPVVPARTATGRMLT